MDQNWDFVQQEINNSPASRSAIYVYFYNESVPDEVRSAAEGRPCFKDVVFICKKIPFTNDDRRREATKQDFAEFPREWAAFQANQPQEGVSGTPLRVWPLMTQSMVKEAATQGLHTVEQLAEMPDNAMQRMGPAWGALRVKARDWLLNAKSSAVLFQLRDENQKLRAEMETLKQMVVKQATELGHPAQIAATSVGLTEAPKKRRGRPPKNPPPEA